VKKYWKTWITGMINLARESFRYKCTKVPVQFVGNGWGRWQMIWTIPFRHSHHMTPSLSIWNNEIQGRDLYRHRTHLWDPLSNTTRTHRFVCSPDFQPQYTHIYTYRRSRYQWSLQSRSCFATIASTVDRHLQGAHYHNLYLPAFRLLSIDDCHAGGATPSLPDEDHDSTQPC
jgi:hypothetical protein